MAYINYQLLYQRDLTERDYHTLQKIIQKDFGLIEKKDCLNIIRLGFIEETKGGYKLSKKGAKLISQLSTPKLTEGIVQLSEMLIEQYETLGKPYGVKAQVQSRISWFHYTTGISLKEIYQTTLDYLNENIDYTLSLENLFWRPQSKAFSVSYRLQDSRLFDEWCKKRDIDSETFLTNRKTKLLQWLFDISKLSIPKRMGTEYTFTGSIEGDIKALEKINNEYKNLIKKYR